MTEAVALPGFETVPAVEEPGWGIDPAIKWCSLALLLPPGSIAGHPVIWHTIRLPGLPPVPRGLSKAEKEARNQERRRLYGTRLAESRDLLSYEFTELAMRYGRPAWIGVEQPFAVGRMIDPISWGIWAVTMEVCGELFGKPPIAAPVVPIEPMSWKASALGKGRGHARKPEVLTWAREVAAYPGTLEDEADATGVAVATARRRAAGTHGW